MKYIRKLLHFSEQVNSPREDAKDLFATFTMNTYSRVSKGKIDVIPYQWYSFSAQVVRKDPTFVNNKAFLVTLRCGFEVKQSFGIHYVKSAEFLFCPQETIDVSFQFFESILSGHDQAHLSLIPIEGRYYHIE